MYSYHDPSKCRQCGEELTGKELIAGNIICTDCQDKAKEEERMQEVGNALGRATKRCGGGV